VDERPQGLLSWFGVASPESRRRVDELPAATLSPHGEDRPLREACCPGWAKGFAVCLKLIGWIFCPLSVAEKTCDELALEEKEIHKK
jgi:hypothetical protein